MSKLGGGVELVWFGMSRVKMECEYTRDLVYTVQQVFRLRIPCHSVN